MDILFAHIRADDTLPLRQKVLWPALDLTSVRVPGDDDANHFGATLDGTLLAVLSLFPDGNCAQLRKFAVDPAVQKRGVGSALLRYALDDIDVREVWCDARCTALPFYQRLGFVITGAPFDKSGVAYRKATWIKP